MEIVIVGLGLIGGSLAKALKQNTSHRVLGMDVNDDVLLDACSCGAIDGKAALSDLERVDVVYLCLYPEDILDFVRSYGGRLKPGCVLTDACGIKQEICAAMEALSQNAPYQFVAAIPCRQGAKRLCRQRPQHLHRRLVHFGCRERPPPRRWPWWRAWPGRWALAGW